MFIGNHTKPMFRYVDIGKKIAQFICADDDRENIDHNAFPNNRNPYRYSELARFV